MQEVEITQVRKEKRLKIIQQINDAFNSDKFVVITGPSGVGKTNLAVEILGSIALADKRWHVTPKDFTVSTNKNLIIDEAQKLDKDDNTWTSFIIDVLRNKMKLIFIAQSIADLPHQIGIDIDKKHIEINTVIF